MRIFPAGYSVGGIDYHSGGSNQSIGKGEGGGQILSLPGIMAEDVWETVGPPLSSADNIWEALSLVPKGVTALRCRARTLTWWTGTSTVATEFFAVDADIASPSSAFTTSSMRAYVGDAPGVNAAQPFREGPTVETMIWVPVNKDCLFKARWQFGGTGSGDVDLFLCGYCF